MLTDKYQLYKINDFCFNQRIVENLDNIIKVVKKTSNYNEIPNLLLYGLPGSGKKSLVDYFIFNLFDCQKTDNIIKFKTDIFETEINKHLYKFLISEYFIFIHKLDTPNDKIIIQQIIKSYVSKQTIDNNIKFIILEDVDDLSFYAQMSLRRTMEIYNKRCKFILMSKTNNILDPLKSRCINFRVPRPNNEEMVKVCEKFKQEFKKKKKEFNYQIISELINKSDNKISLLMLNISSYLYDYKNSDEIKYDEIIDNLMDGEILNFGLIRSEIIEMLKLNLETTEIISKIFYKLQEKITDNIKLRKINILEDRLIKKTKIIKNQIIIFDEMIYEILFILKD